MDDCMFDDNHIRGLKPSVGSGPSLGQRFFCNFVAVQEDPITLEAGIHTVAVGGEPTIVVHEQA